jgi:hypothetical protein
MILNIPFFAKDLLVTWDFAFTFNKHLQKTNRELRGG